MAAARRAPVGKPSPAFGLLPRMVAMGVCGALALAALALVALRAGSTPTVAVTAAGGELQASQMHLPNTSAPAAAAPPPRSYAELVLTGVVLGTVHVLSGPDHLAALVTLAGEIPAPRGPPPVPERAERRC